MARRKFLGLVDQLEPLTYGQPGERTFNITAQSQYGTGVTWLEKEQLYSISDSLGSAISLLEIAPDPTADAGQAVKPDEDDPSDYVEFKAWQISLQYDEQHQIFLFTAAGPDPDATEDEQSENPNAIILHFGFSYQQAGQLAARGMEIVAAGRPICPYCGIPIEDVEDHKCRRRNGHHAEEARAILDALDGTDEE